MWNILGPECKGKLLLTYVLLKAFCTDSKQHVSKNFPPGKLLKHQEVMCLQLSSPGSESVLIPVPPSSPLHGTVSHGLILFLILSPANSFKYDRLFSCARQSGDLGSKGRARRDLTAVSLFSFCPRNIGVQQGGLLFPQAVEHVI